MTDTEIITQVKYHLIEAEPDAMTMPSELWTLAEVVEALNTAQEWIVRSGVAFARTTLVTVPNLNRYALPQDWMVTQRVSFESADGAITDVPRDSSWSADYLDYNWTVEMQSVPQMYTDVDAPIPQIQIMPAASDAGLLTILYAAIPTALDASGVNWTIPDIFIPMAKWKAIAILLAKDGRGQDLPRAAIAMTRADEGMAALTLFLNGWHQ